MLVPLEKPTRDVSFEVSQNFGRGVTKFKDTQMSLTALHDNFLKYVDFLDSADKLDKMPIPNQLRQKNLVMWKALKDFTRAAAEAAEILKKTI